MHARLQLSIHLEPEPQLQLLCRFFHGSMQPTTNWELFNLKFSTFCLWATACSSQVARILLIIRKCWMKDFHFSSGYSSKTSCSFSERHVRSVQCVWRLQWLSCAGVLPCVNENDQILSLFTISHKSLWRSRPPFPPLIRHFACKRSGLSGCWGRTTWRSCRWQLPRFLLRRFVC